MANPLLIDAWAFGYSQAMIADAMYGVPPERDDGKAFFQTFGPKDEAPIDDEMAKWIIDTVDPVNWGKA